MISIVLVLLFIVVMIAGYVDWQKIFERFYGNNPSKARIYIEADEHVTSLSGKLLYTGTKGVIYGYKRDKVDLVVCVPFNYPYKFIRGRRMIRVVAGEASPRVWDETQLSKDGVFSVSALVRSHLVRELVRSMTGGSEFNWKVWLLIGGVVIVAGVVAYNMLLAPEVEPALQPPVTSILVALGVV